jgi:NAD(P)-dependent dehydrogenase (short-subunit alcohol dehydrogenase family)
MTAVVTGGGGGIGSAIATVLAGDGAHVLISGRTQATLERVCDALGDTARAAGGSIGWHVADSVDEDQVRTLVAAGLTRTGRLDMAVNVVGGVEGGAAPVLRYGVERLEATLRQNIVSAYLLLKHAGGAMVRDGGGSFVAVSSIQATQPAPFLGGYCASKAGLEMLCKVAADELGEHNVRVNVVRPGATRTDRASSPTHDPAAVAAFHEQQPLRRTGEPRDIAHAVRYFLGPESAWTTGAVLTVDGGNSLRRAPDLGCYRRNQFGGEIDRAARGEVE